MTVMLLDFNEILTLQIIQYKRSFLWLFAIGWTWLKMWIRLSLWVVFCFKEFWKKFRHFYWRKHLMCGFVTEIAFFFFFPHWPILKKVQDRCVSSFLQRRDFFSEKEAYQFRTWSQICQSDFFSPLNTHFCLCPWNHLTWFIFVTQRFVSTVKPFLMELFKGLLM